MALPLNLALLSAGVLGFRHGFDYDHIAAISDITSVQNSALRAMKLGLLYVLGHAATVALLGSMVILFDLSLLRGADRVAQLLVGSTLVVLAGYVIVCIALKRHQHIRQSRILLLIAAGRWLLWRIESRRNPQLERPMSFTWKYDRKSVFVIGMIHGLGAETSTQLLVFLLAANLGGIAKGFLGLSTFLAGLLLMNALMTAGAAAFFQVGTRRPWLQAMLMGFTAAYSLVVGVVFLLGG